MREAVLIDKEAEQPGIASVLIEHWVAHLCHVLRKIYSDFWECRLLTLLSMFEKNAMGIVLAKEDPVKLRYLIAAVTTSRSLGKSTLCACYFSVKATVAGLSSFL